MIEAYDYLVVGAGISGITAANILAGKNKKVSVVEKRANIGGNCYDFYNDEGLLIHLYGPHIFHTSDKEVWEYLSRFTEWLDYVHYVKAFIDGKYISFPINIRTFEQLFEKPFSREDVEAWLDREKENFSEIKNAEDMVISRMGRYIYETFFKNYTLKQWGVGAEKLAPEITARIPIRLSRDERFFTDQFQGVPKKGYTKMFENMLEHENISVFLGTDYKEMAGQIKYDTIIFTGPFDEFFDYRYGPLPYRGITFEFEVLDKDSALPCAVVNYPNDFDYTRVTEFKKLTRQDHKKTCLCYEYPGESIAGQQKPVPSYPVLNNKSRAIFEKYKCLADKQDTTIFLGRLGQFQYLNMDECVKNALQLFS